MDECDPSIEEIPENELNVATRQINFANALGVSVRKERTGPHGALVLSIPDSTAEYCASLICCECMLRT